MADIVIKDEFLPLGKHKILRFRLYLESNLLYVSIDNDINILYKISDDIDSKFKIYVYKKICEYQYIRTTRFFPKKYNYNSHLNLLNQISIDIHNLLKSF